MNAMESLRVLLIADTAVASLAATRVYMTVAPPEAARPFIVLTRTISPGFSTFDSTKATRKLGVQIDQYADTYAKAYQLQEAVQELLDGRNSLTQPEISAIWHLNSQDSYEAETERHRILSEYFIVDRSE